MSTVWCSISDCGRKVSAAGLCATHRRRKRLGLLMSAPIREREVTLSEAEALTASALQYADAETDDEFRDGKAALLKAALTYVREEHPIGRPPRLTRAQAESAVAMHGNKSAAARALGVSRRTVRRALARSNGSKVLAHQVSHGERS